MVTFPLVSGTDVWAVSTPEKAIHSKPGIGLQPSTPLHASTAVM